MHANFKILSDILRLSKNSIEGSEGKREKKHSIDSAQNLVIDNFSFIYHPDKNHPSGFETKFESKAFAIIQILHQL